MTSKNSKKLIKFAPILLSLFAISVSGAIIGKHEMQLNNSQPIFVELAPLDPRSIMQGDYMQLRYDLYLKQQTDGISDQFLPETVLNQHKITAFVALDNDKKLISTNLQGKDEQHNIPVIIKNPRNYASDLYIASKTFMFAEGLAECYEEATYAKIMVDNDGNAILKSLVGDDQQDLNCENNQSWWNKN